MEVGQQGKYLYKQGGQQFPIDAEVIGVKGVIIEIQFIHPGASYRHRRELRTPAERARFSFDGTFDGMPSKLPKKAKQAEKLVGNQNAIKGEHASQVLRLPVEIVDALYQCLQLDGEPVEDNPKRINEYALGIISGYIRKRIEYNEAMIV